jgi:hypothetical protein
VTAAQLTGSLRQRLESATGGLSAGPLSTVRRIGYTVLALQCVLSLVWSAILYQRFALTFDYTVNQQAWFLIAHGNLDPFSSTQGFPVWRDHSEFLLWPLAAVYWMCPSGATLLWLQDLCVFAAEVLAFTWLCELAERHARRGDAVWLASVGLVLLVANPWMWWTVSFDFHIETFATLFAILLARDLTRGRRRAWVWVVPLLACGDVAATYTAGIGLGAVLFSRRTRVSGALLACLGVAALLVISLVHGNEGSGLELSYGYLATSSPGVTLTLAGLIKGVAAHPGRVLRTLWIKRADLVANLGPSGLAGIADPLVFPIVAIVLVSATLYGGLGQYADLLAEPTFQSLPVYLLMPLGTVAVLGRLLRRRRRLALVLAGLLAAQTVGWWAIWGTRTPSQWLRVSAPAAATLASVEAKIPPSAGVVASNGIIGRFSNRTELQRLLGPGPVTVYPQTWFIIAPSQGSERQSLASAMALMAELAGPLHATLVTRADGVWVFRWTPPSGVRQLMVPDGASPLPAWAATGAVSRPVTAGPVPEWHLAAAGGRGYVADGMEWMTPPGHDLAGVTLSASGPVSVQVWDDNDNTLLASRTITRSTAIKQITLPVDVPDAPDAVSYSGWGPFRAQFVPPPAGQRIEVRVWSPGGVAVNVYGAQISEGG